MKRALWAMIFTAAAGTAMAEGERAGEFDYYVLALSWTPSWCAIEGDARGSAQCDPGLGFGFTLHGLWPQYEDGWPSYCPTVERNPSRAMTRDQAPLFGTSGLAWHQWNKHGTCTGLSAQDYYRLSQVAYGSVTRPDLLRRLDREVRLPAEVIEDAFLEENPDLTDDMLTVTCRGGRIQEVRICLTRDLEPRTCAADVRRDCSLTDALFSPMR
ncbi:MAG: ribonuclease T2 [Pseudomonadota bacterium]